jgi:hypothetical protein
MVFLQMLWKGNVNVIVQPWLVPTHRDYAHVRRSADSSLAMVEEVTLEEVV